MKRYFFFDFDDTIAASFSFNQNIFVHSNKQIIGDNFDEEYCRLIHTTKKGTPMAEQFKAVFHHHNIDEKLVTDATNLNNRLQFEKANEIKLFEDTINYLKILKIKGNHTALFSNRDQKSLKSSLVNNNAYELFDNVISCFDSGFEKPDPTLLNRYIDENSIDRNQVLYFGDSQTDKLFAQGANIDFLIIDHYLNNEKVFNYFIRNII